MLNAAQDYIKRLQTRLATVRAYHALEERCRKEGRAKLLVVAQNVVEGDGDDDAIKADFIAFLRGDGDAASMVTRYHTRQLAAFDAFDEPLAGELKAAGRAMLEGEFAAWYGHKQLLSAAQEDPAVLEALDTDEAMSAVINSDDGFTLHEQLSFAEIWAEVFPNNGSRQPQ